MIGIVLAIGLAMAFYGVNAAYHAVVNTIPGGPEKSAEVGAVVGKASAVVGWTLCYTFLALVAIGSVATVGFFIWAFIWGT
jgi:hypothetical protein